MTASRPASAAAALLLAACASAPDRTVAVSAFSIHVALPPAAAAAVIASAVRDTLPRADPEPYAGGAPATRLSDDEFEVVYERRGRSWLPAARHRIHEPAAGGPVRVAATDRLPGFGLNADGGFRLVVRGAGPPDRAPVHSIVEGEFPTMLRAVLRAALTTDLARRQRCSQSTRALALAHEFAQTGELEYARHYRAHAALATADPTLRAHIARSLHVPATGDAARRQAGEHIAADDLATARALLHTARRADPIPKRDYELLWRLHRRDGDRRFAFAAALLLREYDRLGPGNAAAIAELQSQDLADLVERALSLDPSYRAITRPTAPR